MVLKRFEGAVKDQAVSLKSNLELTFLSYCDLILKTFIYYFTYCFQIKLIAKLKAAEEQESPKTPLNIYRKMIGKNYFVKKSNSIIVNNQDSVNN